MSTLELTPHAIARLAQRAVSIEDIEIISLIATDVECGYLVREKDFQAFERALNQLRDRARRLVGKRVVVDGDRVVTAYHTGRSKERQLLHHAEQGALKA